MPSETVADLLNIPDDGEVQKGDEVDKAEGEEIGDCDDGSGDGNLWDADVGDVFTIFVSGTRNAVLPLRRMNLFFRFAAFTFVS